MFTTEVVFEDQTFAIARRALATTCELFVANPRLAEKPYRVRSRASEAHFRLFLAAIDGDPMEITVENALDLESLSREFQFVELGRQVGEFISKHPHVEVPGLSRRLWTCRGSWRSTVGSSGCLQRRMGGRGQRRTRSLRACRERLMKPRNSNDKKARRSRGWRRRWGKGGLFLRVV
jgi:hypothetical protein